MLNWMCFPKNLAIDETSILVINAFEKVQDIIDSSMYTYKSDEVLKIVRPHLESIGFEIEKGKKEEEKIKIPVLYGLRGKVEKSFDADGYNAEAQYVIEVEAGRAVVNYQFLKDFFEACAMCNVSRLCIAVRNTYQNSKDFEKMCLFFETMYASNRLGIPLSSILLIGY